MSSKLQELREREEGRAERAELKRRIMGLTTQKLSRMVMTLIDEYPHMVIELVEEHPGNEETALLAISKLYGVTDGTYSPTTRQIREAINIGIRDGTDKVVGYGKRIMKQGHY